MALWQFHFKPIPRPSPTVTPEELWSRYGWEDRVFPESLLSRLSNLLPLCETYGDQEDLILVYGEPSRNDIKVFYEEGRVVSIGLRLDLRNLEVGLLQSIVEATADEGAVFISSEERVFEAEWETVIAELLASRAAHFVQNPLGFLKGVAKSAGRRGPPNQNG